MTSTNRPSEFSSQHASSSGAGSQDAPLKEVQMARELLNAASKTFEMAQHIRKLENKIDRLRRKIKKRKSSDSSISDSESEENSSSDSDDSHYNRKHRAKRKRQKKKKDKSALKRRKRTSDSDLAENDTEIGSQMKQLQQDSNKLKQSFKEENKSMPNVGERFKIKDDDAIDTSSQGTPYDQQETEERDAQLPEISSPIHTPTHNLQEPGSTSGGHASVLQTPSPSASSTLKHKTQIKALTKQKPTVQPGQFVVESKFHRNANELEMICQDCGLRIAKVAQVHHSKVCRKTPVCLYCANTFASLDELNVHKPGCKEANWHDHPVRLLQHDLNVPDSSLKKVQVPTTKIMQQRRTTLPTTPRPVKVYHLCLQCDQQFSTPQDLADHKSDAQNCVRFMKDKRRPGMRQMGRFCYGCNMNFANTQQFNKHKTDCDEKIGAVEMFNCFLCYKRFSSKEELTQHRFSQHMTARGENSNCWSCGMVFKSFQDLLNHHDKVHKGEVQSYNTSRRRKNPSASASQHRVLTQGAVDNNEEIKVSAELVTETLSLLNTMQNETGVINCNEQDEVTSTTDPAVMNTGPEQINIEDDEDLPVLRQQKSIRSSHNEEDEDLPVLRQKNVRTYSRKVASTSGPQNAQISGYGKAIDNSTAFTPLHVAEMQIDAAQKNSADCPTKIGPISNTSSQSPTFPTLKSPTPNLNQSTSKMNNLISSLGTNSAIQQALSKQGLKAPIKIYSGNPDLVKNIRNLGSNCKQIMLPGNKTGYILAVKQPIISSLVHSDTSFSIINTSNAKNQLEKQQNIDLRSNEVMEISGKNAGNAKNNPIHIDTESNDNSISRVKNRQKSCDLSESYCEEVLKRPLATSCVVEENHVNQAVPFENQVLTELPTMAQTKPNTSRQIPLHRDLLQCINSISDQRKDKLQDTLTDETKAKERNNESSSQTRMLSSCERTLSLDNLEAEKMDSSVDEICMKVISESKGKRGNKKGKNTKSKSNSRAANTEGNVDKKKTEEETAKIKTSPKIGLDKSGSVNQTSTTQLQTQHSSSVEDKKGKTNKKASNFLNNQKDQEGAKSKQSTSNEGNKKETRKRNKQVKRDDKKNNGNAKESIDVSMKTEKNKNTAEVKPDKDQNPTPNKETFSSSLSGMDQITTLISRARKRRIVKSSPTVTEKSSTKLKKTSEVDDTTQSKPKKTITSGGIEMLVNDDKIVCSVCRSVMSSVVEIAKHKCSTNTQIKSEFPKKESIAVSKSKSGVQQSINEQNITRSPKLRSYTNRNLQRNVTPSPSLAVNELKPKSSKGRSQRTKINSKVTRSKTVQTASLSAEFLSINVDQSSYKVDQSTALPTHDSGSALVAKSPRQVGPNSAITQKRGMDLGPELVEVIDAELSDGCNVDIVGDEDGL